MTLMAHPIQLSPQLQLTMHQPNEATQIFATTISGTNPSNLRLARTAQEQGQDLAQVLVSNLTYHFENLCYSVLRNSSYFFHSKHFACPLCFPKVIRNL